MSEHPTFSHFDEPPGPFYSWHDQLLLQTVFEYGYEGVAPAQLTARLRTKLGEETMLSCLLRLAAQALIDFDHFEKKWVLTKNGLESVQMLFHTILRNSVKGPLPSFQCEAIEPAPFALDHNPGACFSTQVAPRLQAQVRLELRKRGWRNEQASLILLKLAEQTHWLNPSEGSVREWAEFLVAQVPTGPEIGPFVLFEERFREKRVH